MRTLAIGDMHGCLTALDRLLAEVRLQPDDRLITLGDYVDRGPDSKGVIERLLQLSNLCTLVPLRGNHDVMMAEARKARRGAASWRQTVEWLMERGRSSTGLTQEEKEWLDCGGRQTLASYAPEGIIGTLDHVPEAHWHFLEQTCVDWYETERHFFVHANVYPDWPLAEQPTSMLHWEKLYEARPHMSGKIMVCGHTAQRSGKPLDLDHAVCIDTWVYGEGWLTCLDVENRLYWQANEQGETRMANLDRLSRR